MDPLAESSQHSVVSQFGLNEQVPSREAEFPPNANVRRGRVRVGDRLRPNCLVRRMSASMLD